MWVSVSRTKREVCLLDFLELWTVFTIVLCVAVMPAEQGDDLCCAEFYAKWDYVSLAERRCSSVV